MNSSPANLLVDDNSAACRVLAVTIAQDSGGEPEVCTSYAEVMVNALRNAGFIIMPPAPQFPPEEIYNAIKTERIQQDQQWGGPEHDDKHSLDDWSLFIEYQLAQADGVGGPEFRERMVKVAALAVAAIESWDRVYKDAPQPSTQQVAG